jgi:RNA polymerase primary sigma factor
MDLIAEGNVGLITAARRFDERRGFRFISYAVWWIRQAIQKALAEQTNTVRLPVNRMLQAQNYRQLRSSLEHEHQRPVRDEEVASALGLSERRLEQIRAANRPLFRLDQELNDEEDTTLADRLIDSNEATPEERYIRDEMGRELASALSLLSERERTIIIRYYGLAEDDAWSLEAIGQEMRLSRERVRQLRNRALEKMREAANGETLMDYLR